MYILKNAWLTITRNKGRNILIGIIIVVIAAASAVTLAIRNSATKLIESYKEQYEIVGSISTNRKNMMQGFDPSSGGDIDDIREAFNDIDPITIDDVSSYADSSYVTSYYYTNSVNLDGKDIDPAATSKKGNSGGGNKNPGMMGGQPTTTSTSDFTLTGYSSLTAMTDFIEGSYTIKEGSVSMDSYSCIINSELATLNELSVGDTITLVDPDNSKKKYTFTISGIYEDNSESEGGMINMFTNSVNNIITSSDTINDIVEDDDDLDMTVTPSFVLKDEDSISKFEDELHDKGLSEYMTVTTNLDTVNSSTSSVNNVKTYATTFLIITLIIGAIVLFVINMINVRERKYEIVVLRTIGMKKSTLTFQFMLELILVSFLSLLIGSGIGSSMSVSVANNLLKNEINSSSTKKDDIKNNFGSTDGGESKTNMNFDKLNGVANVSAFTSIDAVVDIKVLAQLLGIGLLLTLVSSLASMISIQRFSPLTILKERG